MSNPTKSQTRKKSCRLKRSRNSRGLCFSKTVRRACFQIWVWECRENKEMESWAVHNNPFLVRTRQLRRRRRNLPKPKTKTERALTVSLKIARKPTWTVWLPTMTLLSFTASNSFVRILGLRSRPPWMVTKHTKLFKGRWTRLSRENPGHNMDSTTRKSITISSYWISICRYQMGMRRARISVRSIMITSFSS